MTTPLSLLEVNRLEPVPPATRISIDGIAANGPWFDITHGSFGAKGDGSDDTARIQAAIDAANIVGGSVYVPPGSFNHTGLVLADKTPLIGAGYNVSILNFTPVAGVAIDSPNRSATYIRDVMITTNTPASTATGIRILGSDQGLIQSLFINQFSTNIKVTGTSADRSFNTRFHAVASINALVCALSIDHAIDTHLTNVLLSTQGGVPADWVSLLIDTGASGIYINAVSALFGAIKVTNSAPSAAAGDFAPEWIFGHTVLADTVQATDAIIFDASLSVPDGLGRKGKGYHFTDVWAAFTQTNGKVGIKISGGEDISLTDVHARFNRYHGIHIAGGSDIRINNPFVTGNNAQGAADGDGIHVDANKNDFHILGGRIGNNLAGDAGLQRFGICIDAGSSTSYSVIGVNCSSNATAPISDGGAGTKFVLGVHDFAGGAVMNDRLYGKRRLELGDGNSFIDYQTIGANQIYYSFDTGDYFVYDRVNNVLTFVVGNVVRAAIDANGVTVGAGTNGAIAVSRVRHGQTTLVAGTKAVADTTVTANTKIFLTVHTPGGTPGWLQVSARVVGTSFTILSSNAADTSVVDYLMIEP